MQEEKLKLIGKLIKEDKITMEEAVILLSGGEKEVIYVDRYPVSPWVPYIPPYPMWQITAGTYHTDATSSTYCTTNTQN